MPGVGDPGLFGTIGNIIGKVAGVAKAIPGPIGWAGTAVSKVAGGGGSSRANRPQWIKDLPVSESIKQQYERALASGGGVPQVPVPGLTGALQRLVPGGQTGMQPAPAVGAPSGYHVNKTDYFLKDGTFIPAGSRWVKNRKRNPLNPRAASKAIGRLESLKRATKRFNRITVRKKSCS